MKSYLSFAKCLIVLFMLVTLTSCGVSKSNQKNGFQAEKTLNTQNILNTNSVQNTTPTTLLSELILTSSTTSTSTSTTTTTILYNIVGTIAGMPGIIGSTDGSKETARFNWPYGITQNETHLFVSEMKNNTIRMIDKKSGEVKTLAGIAGIAGNGDGLKGTFNGPSGIAADGSYLFVADLKNHTIRKIVIATGEVSTIAGSAGMPGKVDAVGTRARFHSPCCITTDGNYLYLTEYGNYTIRMIDLTTRKVSTLAGKAGVSGDKDGKGSSAEFLFPQGITKAGGFLFVTDSENHTIRKIEIATGMVTTFAGKAMAKGQSDGTALQARFNVPRDITGDGHFLYVADTGNHTIRKIELTTGNVVTIAGNAGFYGSTDGVGREARFYCPQSICKDRDNLYVTDINSHTIRIVQSL